MKDIKVISVNIYSMQKHVKFGDTSYTAYPELDHLLTTYANSGYAIKTMSENPPNHILTIVLEKEI